jgi:type I restriction enzyme S subunit
MTQLLDEPLTETEIGTLPADWGVSTIADLFEIQQGKALNPKARAGKCPKPFLRTANVFWGLLDFSTLDEMDFDDDEVERLTLQHGDLLVCEGGDIGRTAMWEGGDVGRASRRVHVPEPFASPSSSPGA